MWGKLTPLDIDRAVGELARRRQETLARHARELAELDADDGQIAALKRAINAFALKFKAPSGDGEKRGDESANVQNDDADLQQVS